MSKLSAIAACLFACGVLSACGGGGSNDDSQITDAVNAAAVSGDASACTEAQTQRFTEQSEGSTGSAAIAACKKSAGQNNADSVDVTEIKVDGDKATANVAVTGSAFDGQTLAISFVKDNGTWKLDYIEDIPNFDATKFAASFTAQALKAGQLSAAQVKCITGNIASAGPTSIKQAILSGNQAALAPLFAGC